MSEEKETLYTERTEAIGYAFWPYDQFPFLVGGEFTKILDNGRVYVPSWQMNTKPKYITSVEHGRVFKAVLRNLEAARKSDIKQVEDEYKKHLDKNLEDAGFTDFQNSKV